jgi:DNA-binding HxlR family transcriptional regulator
MDACPRQYGLQIIARKWSYFLLRSLNGPKSFSDIKRELRFVTNHVLSRELKQLRTEGLIEQQDELYAITPAGKTLLDAVEPLYRWGVEQKHLGACPPQLACSRCTRYPSVVRKQYPQ